MSDFLPVPPPTQINFHQVSVTRGRIFCWREEQEKHECVTCSPGISAFSPPVLAPAGTLHGIKGDCNRRTSFRASKIQMAARPRRMSIREASDPRFRKGIKYRVPRSYSAPNRRRPKPSPSINLCKERSSSSVAAITYRSGHTERLIAHRERDQYGHTGSTYYCREGHRYLFIIHNSQCVLQVECKLLITNWRRSCFKVAVSESCCDKVKIRDCAQASESLDLLFQLNKKAGL